jgi:dipeptidyl aminopeptidase/acylaminoacyl peptidase
VYAAVDGNLWWQRLDGGSARRITDHGPERAAQAPASAPDGVRVVYVVDQAEVWCARVAVDATDPAPRPARRLDDGGADFCFDPVVSPDGAVVSWQAWNVPDMPWDGSRVERVELDTGSRSVLRVDGAAQQPGALPDGTPMVVRDDLGVATLWIGDRPAVAGDPYEHAGPSWGLGQRSYAVSPDGREIAFTRNERGFGRLCTLDGATGAVVDVARGVHGQLSWRGSTIAAIRSGARTPTQVVTYARDATAWRRQIHAIGPDPAWLDLDLVEPEAVETVAADGEVLHTRLYRADAPTHRLLCCVHGGPTDQWMVSFLPRVAFWRSRGWNVLVPDHRGSTGHGRAYQQALRGRWGELDVSDVLDVVTDAHARGWGMPAGTALMGGSAGGFTVLGVLGALDALGGADEPPLVAAAVVSYPVTDLAALGERSHRFERHSIDTLVGPPGTPALRDRSPVWFAHRLRRPLLVFHGADDPVVPVEQSRVLAERMRLSGGDVELVVYPGEGHGFRRPEHQHDEHTRAGAFLARHIA